MSKQGKIDKGIRCEKLLDDPDLQAAFQAVRNAIHEAFETCKQDADTLVALKQRLDLLDMVKADLIHAIQDGKLEASRLQKKVSYLGEMK